MALAVVISSQPPRALTWEGTGSLSLPAHARPVRAGLQLPDQGSLGVLSLTRYCGSRAAQALLLLYSSPESISAHLQQVDTWAPSVLTPGGSGGRSASWVGPGLFLGPRGPAVAATPTSPRPRSLFSGSDGTSGA